MVINEREHHIKTLENLLSHYKAREKCEGYYDSTLKDSVEALQYALSSLKTDLKYDLMYEREEIYTKADMVDMLEDLKQDIIAEAYGIEIDCTDYVVNVADIDKVIQQKINALRGKGK